MLSLKKGINFKSKLLISLWSFLCFLFNSIVAKNFLTSKNKKFLQLDSLFPNSSMESSGKFDCKMLSNVISVDTKLETYDLLLSFSTKKKCNFICQIVQTNWSSQYANQNPNELTNTNKTHNIKNNAEKSESYFFSNQYYFFFRFPNLNYKRNYMYKCKSGSYNDFINNIRFPKNENKTNFIAFGDVAETKEANLTKILLEKRIQNNDFILFLGDQAYNLEYNNGRVGDSYMYFLKNITSRIPFQITPGNHESYNNFEHYIKRYIMPMKQKHKNLYYSFDVNNIHFISINSEIPYDFSDEYKKDFRSWLDNDLKNSNQRWKIAFLHRPLYCSFPDNYHCITSGKYMREMLEDIFIKYKIDLVLAGHIHDYERTYPVFNGTVDYNSIRNDERLYENPKFPVNVICGAAGRGGELIKYNIEYFSNITLNKYGVCEVEVNKTTLSLNYISSENGAVLDKFYIKKK